MGRHFFPCLFLDVFFLPVFFLISETATTDRSLHDRRADKLCSHHTRRLWRHGHGPAIGGCISILVIYLFYSTMPSFFFQDLRHKGRTHSSRLCCCSQNVSVNVVDDCSVLGGPCSGPDEIERWLRTRRVWRLPVVTGWVVIFSGLACGYTISHR